MKDFVNLSKTGTTPLDQHVIPIKKTMTHK